MNPLYMISFAKYMLVFIAISVFTTCQNVVDQPPPNILVIVADDLGFSDLGFLGSEIKTPHLDELADESIFFPQFYTAPTCSPTRAMLLTGIDHHLVGLGTMSGEHDTNQLHQPGYEGFLNDYATTIVEVLQNQQYATSMVGKWHLGMEPELGPHQRGFDQSLVLLQGGASHFADSVGLVRPAIPQYRLNGESFTLPDSFFSSSYYTESLMNFITPALSKKPFFAYAAYTAPHWPLQVPDGWEDLYEGVYDEGYDFWRAQRYRQLRIPGMTLSGMIPKRLDFIPAWQGLTTTQRRLSSRKMEIYASMVTHLDHQIGRLLKSLKSNELYDNTWVFFFSDNGPEGNAIQNLLDNEEWIEETFDNSYEHIGKSGSYTFLGPGWAQISAMPFNWFKAFNFEGGIRTPLLVKPPKGKYRTLPTVNTSVVNVRDVSATILDIVRTNNPERFADKDAVKRNGHSLLGVLSGKNNLNTEVYASEIFGRRSYRSGDWKAVWLGTPYGPGAWQLFNLKNDFGEQNNLSEQFPGVLDSLMEGWERYAVENKVILPTKDKGYANEKFD